MVEIKKHSPVGVVKVALDGGFIAALLPGVVGRVKALDPLYLETPDTSVVWCSPDQVPEVAMDSYGYYWAAVRRENGKIHTFPAAYANVMKMDGEEELEETTQYNRARFDPPTASADHCSLATGWFDIKSSSDYDSLFEPLLGKNDELVAWREVEAYQDDDIVVNTDQPVGVVEDGVMTRSPRDPPGEGRYISSAKMSCELPPGTQLYVRPAQQLTEADIARAAAALGVQVPALKAVLDVEASRKVTQYLAASK